MPAKKPAAVADAYRRYQCAPGLNPKRPLQRPDAARYAPTSLGEVGLRRRLRWYCPRPGGRPTNQARFSVDRNTSRAVAAEAMSPQTASVPGSGTSLASGVITKPTC